MKIDIKSKFGFVVGKRFIDMEVGQLAQIIDTDKIVMRLKNEQDKSMRFMQLNDNGETTWSGNPDYGFRGPEVALIPKGTVIELTVAD